MVLDGQPFNGLEIYPADLRQMAQRLTALADLAGKLPLSGKRWAPTKVVIEDKPTVGVMPAPGVIPAVVLDAQCKGRVERMNAEMEKLLQAGFAKVAL